MTKHEAKLGFHSDIVIARKINRESRLKALDTNTSSLHRIILTETHPVFQRTKHGVEHTVTILQGLQGIVCPGSGLAE
jgi:hypothetical protein